MMMMMTTMMVVIVLMEKEEDGLGCRVCRTLPTHSVFQPWKQHLR